MRKHIHFPPVASLITAGGRLLLAMLERMPSLVRYGVNSGIADERIRQRLLEIPLAFLEGETGLSRHTILRARRGQPVHPRSLRLLRIAVQKIPVRKQTQTIFTSLRAAVRLPNDFMSKGKLLRIRHFAS
jgi:hypothetical protein